jgi:hypothetical protein
MFEKNKEVSEQINFEQITTQTCRPEHPQMGAPRCYDCELWDHRRGSCVEEIENGIDFNRNKMLAGCTGDG